MRLLVTLDAETLGGPRGVATALRGYLRALTQQNVQIIRQGAVPPLYSLFRAGRLRFAAEPNAGRYEDFADALTCMHRGWADCGMLVPWRAAEWIVHRKVLALPKLYWRVKDDLGRELPEDRWREASSVGYHAELRLPCKCHRAHDCKDSPVEDVSTFLGMARRGTQEQDRPRGNAA